MSEDFEARLSRMVTHWNSVLEAHGSGTDAGMAARQRLLVRYHEAAYRYLLGAVKDEQTAEELLQEFAVKLMDGAFENASPERGRFRNYLKVSLANLVNQHWRSIQKRAKTLGSEQVEGNPPPTEASSDQFDNCWREMLLQRTWLALQQIRPQYYEVLKLRVDNPTIPANEIARQISRNDRAVSAASARKTLERARAKYANLLIDEVAAAIETDDLDQVQRELNYLKLLPYCKSALAARQQSS